MWLEACCHFASFEKSGVKKSKKSGVKNSEKKWRQKQWIKVASKTVEKSGVKKEKER
jgi:hypothetical protein